MLLIYSAYKSTNLYRNKRSKPKEEEAIDTLEFYIRDAAENDNRLRKLIEQAYIPERGLNERKGHGKTEKCDTKMVDGQRQEKKT